MSPVQILIADKKISLAQLRSLCQAWFGDMVKLVVDVNREVVAIGGELYADGEELLLQQGSQQEDLWGVNFYPWHVPHQRIEYTALINIRPHQDNPTMEIVNQAVREKVKTIIERLVLSADEKLV